MSYDLSTLHHPEPAEAAWDGRRPRRDLTEDEPLADYCGPFIGLMHGAPSTDPAWYAWLEGRWEALRRALEWDARATRWLLWQMALGFAAGLAAWVVRGGR